MPTTWEKNDPTEAFLVALDISGFSNDVDPDRLSEQRMKFFFSVEESRLFPKAKDNQDVKVHFLGDELRLAFLTGVGTREVRDFVDDVFAKLDKINEHALKEYRTRIKGVALKGVVIWKTWINCEYLNGELPVKAQTWMSYLAPDEVAIDETFKIALQIDGVPTQGLSHRKFSGETGYMLRGR